MSAEFAFPDWATADSPPPAPSVDPHRIGEVVNGFIAAKQDALFDAPDAFYRQTGAEAVAAAPTVATRLAGLRDAALEEVHDHERPALGSQLDAQLIDALDGIGRHTARQREARNREIITERHALIERAAALDHNNEAKLLGLAAANAGAAQELAQLDGSPEEPAMRAARSAVWRNAIAERLAIGQAAPALSLFQRVNTELVPADQRMLDVPLQAARTDAATDAWIAREAAKVGDPLSVRVQADAGLSPAEKAATLAKIEERDSARESARIATVQGLDDKLDATADALATKPGTYRPGTLATLANAYEDAGDPAKAAPVRRLAQQESFLRSFARSSSAAQQRLIDSLPEGEDRAAAEAIQDRQAEAFAKDPFGAGTALYPDVGPPKPIDDTEGRVAQARLISAYRGIVVVPFTAAELAKMRQQHASGTSQEREAVRSLVDALPDDMRPPLEGPSPSEPHTFSIGSVPSMTANADLPGEGANENAANIGVGGAAPATEPPPRGPEFAEADRQAQEIEGASWNDLTFMQQLGVSFQRLNAETNVDGAAVGAASAAWRLQFVEDLRRRKASRPLLPSEEQYLLRNRNPAADLRQAVARLIQAQRDLERLPTSDALRTFLQAPTASDAARLLREKPGEITKALGIESLPGLTVSLIASALGPIGRGFAVAGSGLEG